MSMTATRETTVRAPITWDPTTKRSSGTESRRISGLAAVFNTRTELAPGVFEKISPGAFTRALAGDAARRVVLNFGHDSNLLLASVRSGSLKLSQTPAGLRFEADVVKTTTGDDVLSLIRSGDLAECSFAFTIEDESRDLLDEGMLYTIREVGELRDVCVCAQGAYETTSVLARNRADAIERITGTRPRTTVTERSAYGVGSEHSYFADLLTGSRDGERASAETVIRRLQLGPMLNQDSAHEARKRLATVQTRAGDLTTATHMGEFVPAASPSFIRDAFTTTCRATATVSPLYTVVPLAQYATDGAGGKTITVPRIDTGASVAVQATENSTTSNTDQTSSAATSLITTVAGRTVVSQQLWDLGPSTADYAIAQDLGAAYATMLDSELINGSNSAGRTAGLIALTGAKTGSYTDSTPTVAEALASLTLLWRTCYESRGLSPTHCIIAPKAGGLLFSDTTVWNPDHNDPRLPCSPRIVVNGSIPTNTGAGTNQSTVIFVTAPDLILATDGVRFQVSEQTLATNLELVATAFGFAAAGYKRPEGVGISTGTGWAAA